MVLKNIKILNAEDLPKIIKEENGLPATGRIIIETRNPDLRTIFKPMPEGGMIEYLLSLGQFKEVEIEEDK